MAAVSIKGEKGAGKQRARMPRGDGAFYLLHQPHFEQLHIGIKRCAGFDHSGERKISDLHNLGLLLKDPLNILGPLSYFVLLFLIKLHHNAISRVTVLIPITG